MDENVLRYRQRHRKCKYCKHLNVIKGKPGENVLCICEAKKKVVADTIPNMTAIPRWFCGCYEVKS